MIELYFWNTPNGYKPLLYLEEAGLDYEIVPINIKQGMQFESSFKEVSLNSKIPAIRDRDPVGGGEPLSLFESGAILAYFAEKTDGRFVPDTIRGRMKVRQWLFWQVGGLGPMLGQFFHFNVYANEKIPYAIERYRVESLRLFSVLESALTENRYVASSDYSIADMAIYPWMKVALSRFPEVREFRKIVDWMQAIEERPATLRAYMKGEEVVK